MGAHQCRNCGSTELIVADNALLAPFFAKRVHGLGAISVERYIEQKLELSQAPLKALIKKVLAGIKYTPLVGSFFRHPIFFAQAQTRTCRHCGFVGPNVEYTEELLSGLYFDYRSDSYNKDRSYFEPSYHEIEDLVGKTECEVEARQANMGAIIEAFIDIRSVRTVLDWGGGNGQFVPERLSDKDVTIFDISCEPPVPGFLRVDTLGENDKFDYVQVCHVLEHVGSPRDLLFKIVKHVNLGGYLYLEVPKDRCSSDLQKFREYPNSVCHLLHEHINLYSSEALSALSSAAGLKRLEIREVELDIGWTKGTVICGIFQKPLT